VQRWSSDSYRWVTVLLLLAQPNLTQLHAIARVRRDTLEDVARAPHRLVHPYDLVQDTKRVRREHQGTADVPRLGSELVDA
jgi:hypothetical protein